MESGIKVDFEHLALKLYGDNYFLSFMESFKILSEMGSNGLNSAQSIVLNSKYTNLLKTQRDNGRALI
jgi:hypothetical protein